MKSVVMKNLCLVAIVLSLSDSGAVGHIIQHSPLPPHTIGNNVGAISAIGCPNTTKVCQDGFEQLGWQKCYYFSCTADTWDGALATCRSLGATLAYPLNDVENTILVNYIISRYVGATGAWLGGTDAANEGNWVWAHDNSPINYTAWGPGQPAGGTRDNYLQYWAGNGWQWDDVESYPLNAFVCQQL